jgi:DNA-binding CsgD family transcriptional regulator/MFS family permease
MNGFANLWKSRDELYLKNIRKAYIPYMLVFPLGIMLSDVMYHDWELEVLGIDSILFQILVYGFAWLICTFLPKNSIPYVLRSSIIAGIVLVVPTVLLADNGTAGFLLIAVFQLCMGISTACGFYVFSYVLRNAERWLAIAIIGFYYGLSWGIYEIGSVKQFTITILPVILIVVFGVIGIFVKPDILKNASVSISSKNAGMSAGANTNTPAPPPEHAFSTPTQDTDVTTAYAADTKSAASAGSLSTGKDAKQKSARSYKFYFVFILYIVYYLINLTNYYLEYEKDYIDDIFYGAGMITGLVLVALIQLIFNRSVWHLWNLYLTLTVIGLLITGLGIILSTQAGSFIYGVADNIGYIAILYLLGSVAKMDGHYRYFRWACFIMFAHDVIISPLMDELFEHASGPYNITAIAVILVSVAVCFLIAPLLNKTIFNADWIDNLHALDTELYREQIKEVRELDRLEGLNLTSREKQILALMLTELSAKQIAGELTISLGTVNFHSNNLYRKLGIQSRAELFSKYAKDR